MSKEVHTVDSNATVTEAAEIMAADERNEGYVIVLEKGTPKGIVTERDIVNKVVVGRLDPSNTRVSDVMAAPLITVDPDEDLITVSQLMKEQNISKLVVVREAIIYGIITAKDLSQNFQDYVDRSTRDIIRWTASLGF